MLKPLISQDKIEAFRKLMEASANVAVVCHMTPDGDAMGSSLCLMHVLRAAGKSVSVVVPDCPPDNMMFLPGADEVTVASYHPTKAKYIFSRADVIFMLDFNDLKRIDRTAPFVEMSKARRILVDHHLEPAVRADVSVSYPEKSSTCALLYTLLWQAGMDSLIDVDAATCCCAGMMTDTGNFSYNSNDPELYKILAALVEKGVDKDALYARIFNTSSLNRIRIMGYSQYAKMRVLPEHKAALITLSRDELNEFDYKKGDTEALVNVPLSVPGIVYSVYLREDEPDYVKVSMRSKGDFSVKEICECHFGGGGHKNAAGGEFHGSLGDAVARVIGIMPLYDSKLPGDGCGIASDGQ